MSARILLIEDNPANLELLCYLLRAFGHTVLAATDGGNGLRVAEEACPDLVLCDIQLPDIDGYEIARRLRQLPKLATTPLVAVTALARPSDRQQALAAGFDGYFSKPIEPESFLAGVEAFLPPTLRSTGKLNGGKNSHAEGY